MYDEIKQEFGARLQKEISDRGITQIEFATKARITEVALHRYITGQKLPNILTALSIADALGVSLDYIADMIPRRSE